jgi:hypothetical protein
MNIRGGSQERNPAYNEGHLTSYLVCEDRETYRLWWICHVANNGEIGSTYTILVQKPVRKQPLGRARKIWNVNISMHGVDIGYEGGWWM